MLAFYVYCIKCKTDSLVHTTEDGPLPGSCRCGHLEWTILPNRLMKFTASRGALMMIGWFTMAFLQDDPTVATDLFRMLKGREHE